MRPDSAVSSNLKDILCLVLSNYDNSMIKQLWIGNNFHSHLLIIQVTPYTGI